MSLLLSGFRTTSDPTCLPTLPVSSSSKKESNTKNIVWLYLVKLWLFSRILFNTLVDVLLFIATVLFLKDSQSPFIATQGFNASTRKRFICRTVSLDDIKLIKNVTNATVNDVVLGITQAALSRYIYRRYEVEANKKFSVQKMRCRDAVAVNLRPALGVQAVVEMIEKNGTVVQGNVVGPLEEVSSSGNPLTFLAATTSYGHFNGLTVHTCSYAKQLTFAIAIDEGKIPDYNTSWVMILLMHLLTSTRLPSQT